MSDIFDFIVVGGGTSGCVVARRLASSRSAPKVLLIEGGGPNNSIGLRAPDRRWTAAFIEPEQNWGYKSLPQPQLNDRVISCPRGRGLGGSSAINFSCWLIGDKHDFNQWADLVDDPAWKWEGEGGVKKRFRKIENVHNNLTDEQAKYVSRHALDEHSHEGMVNVSYPHVWSNLDFWALEAGKDYGKSAPNGDINSGDPVGFGIAPTTYFGDERTTSASAYLSSPPSNLTIVTNSIVSKVIFDGSKRAIGVSTISGQVYRAEKEVILSAGAFDTPKILLLSGIGPSEDLAKHSIPVVHDLPGVGKNMKDHCYMSMDILLKQGIHAVPSPILDTGLQTPMAWLSSPAVKSSPEFDSLPKSTKEFLQKVPSYEFLFSQFPAAVALPRPDAEVIQISVAVMNAQSRGSITLASFDPSVPMAIDLNYLSHPYDRRVAIEALRAALALARVPTLKNVSEKILNGPKSESEEDVFEFAKEFVQPVFHFASTCRMGKDDDEMSVVNKDFKVKGIEGLRVTDHAVAPLMINNHTQSTCYLIGETAAEKIIAEYRL